MKPSQTTMNVDGNIIAVMTGLPSREDLSEDTSLRRQLVRQFADKVDTVMLLSDESNRIQVAVFEPNAGPDGGFSTFCGNGMKAVATLFDGSTIFQTPVGMIKTEFIGNYTRIDCGQLRRELNHNLCESLKECVQTEMMDTYVSGDLVSVTPNPLLPGEPHLVIRLRDSLTMKMLSSCLTKVSRKATDKLSRNDFNLTFYSVQCDGPDTIVIFAITYERNLGKNPITGSCGTGAMSVSGHSLSLNSAPSQSSQNFMVNYPAGIVEVVQEGQNLLLVGKKKYESL